MVQLNDDKSSDWEMEIDLVAKEAIEEQSVPRLARCREKLVEILATHIPADMILHRLADSFYEHIENDILLKRTAKLVAECDLNLSLGTHPILHLDALVAKFMATAFRIPPPLEIPKK